MNIPVFRVYYCIFVKSEGPKPIAITHSTSDIVCVLMAGCLISRPPLLQSGLPRRTGMCTTTRLGLPVCLSYVCVHHSYDWQVHDLAFLLSWISGLIPWICSEKLHQLFMCNLSQKYNGDRAGKARSHACHCLFLASELLAVFMEVPESPHNPLLSVTLTAKTSIRGGLAFNLGLDLLIYRAERSCLPAGSGP